MSKLSDLETRAREALAEHGTFVEVGPDTVLDLITLCRAMAADFQFYNYKDESGIPARHALALYAEWETP